MRHINILKCLVDFVECGGGPIRPRAFAVLLGFRIRFIHGLNEHDLCRPMFSTSLARVDTLKLSVLAIEGRDAL